MSAQAQMVGQAPHTIAGRLRFAREHRGWSAADLRRKMAGMGVEVSRSRLWNYENRPDTMPRPEILAVISDVTGFNAGWLLTGQEPIFSATPAVTQVMGESPSLNDSWNDWVEDREDLEQLIEVWNRMPRRKRRVLREIADLLHDEA